MWHFGWLRDCRLRVWFVALRESQLRGGRWTGWTVADLAELADASPSAARRAALELAQPSRIARGPGAHVYLAITWGRGRAPNELEVFDPPRPALIEVPRPPARGRKPWRVYASSVTVR